MRSAVYLFLSSLLLLPGCRKEPLPPVGPGEPVFYVNCDAGVQQVRLEAGNDDYYMNPVFYEDSNGVLVLKADLSKPGCEKCYAVSILLHNHITSSINAASYVDSLLRPGHFLYNDRIFAAAQYSVQLKPEGYEDPTGIYTWTISEKDQADVYKKGFVVNMNFNALKSYSVSLAYEDATGCSSKHLSVYNLGYASQPQIRAVRSNSSDLTYSFSAVALTGDPVSYYWEFGDGKQSDEAALVHTYEPMGGGYYTATLTATDMQNKKSTAFYQIPGTVDAVCTANFVADITAIPNIQSFSKITIELRDNEGRVYSTRNFAQPQTSDFEIISVEDYKNNSQGDPTKKVKAKFNCLLKYGAQELQLNNGEAVVAFSYE